jgi:hypothetical protein
MAGRGQNRFRFRFQLILSFSFSFFRLSLPFLFRPKNRKKLENDFRKLEIIIFVFIPRSSCHNVHLAQRGVLKDLDISI